MNRPKTEGSNANVIRTMHNMPKDKNAESSCARLLRDIVESICEKSMANEQLPDHAGKRMAGGGPM